MKSFKEYERTNPNINTPTDTLDAEELTRRLTSAYEGKSDVEMLRNILEEAEKSKRAGTLSNEELEMFYQSFSPMLDAFQRKALRAIVDKLKAL